MMNKVYRIIWNSTLGLWAVTSELGRGKIKSAASKALSGSALLPATAALSRISAAALLALVSLPEASASCSVDSSGLKFTCSGSAPSHLLLDLAGKAGDVQVTVTPDFVSNDSLYIGNIWDLSLNNGTEEPQRIYDEPEFRSDRLSVILEAGNKLSQYIAPEQESLRRVLYIEASTNKLSVAVNRDIEQSLYGSGKSTDGYQHAIDIRNTLNYMAYRPGDESDFYSPIDNNIAINGNIRQTAINTDFNSIMSHVNGGFIGVNAVVAGIKNRIAVTGDVTQDIISDTLYGSFSGSEADIAGVRVFSNSIKDGSSYSAQFASLPIVEKAENYVEISGNIKQNFSMRDSLQAYVQSPSNYINNGVFVNVAGVNNTVLVSGDIERTTSANFINEMIGSGVNVQSNVYEGLNTGVMSTPTTPDSALFTHDIVNNVNISGNIKQTVTADTVYSDTSASAGKQAFSTAGVQVMGSQNTISVSGDVSKEIDITSIFNTPPGAVILVQANATPLGSFNMGLSFTPEMWDMVARSENRIDISGNAIHRITGGDQSTSMSYDIVNHSSVDITANGINNIISVSGDIERAFSGELTSMPLYSNSALKIKSNFAELHQTSGMPMLFSPYSYILEQAKNNIHLSGNVNQEINFQQSEISQYSTDFDNNFEPSPELFATDIAVAGRNSTLLISGNTNSSVSLSPNEDNPIPGHAGGIRLRNYYGDMDTLITGSVTVSDEKDVANGLLSTAPPSLCLTTLNSACPGGMEDNPALKYASVGIRATNYGDTLNLAIEGDIVSSGIGIQVRPFAENPEISAEDYDGELLAKGKGDVMVDIAARVQGSGGYALEASQITDGHFTLGLRDSWALDGAAYAAYSNPNNTLLLHGDTDTSLDLARLSNVGEWQWIDSEGNLTGYTLSGNTIANLHHLVKDGGSSWSMTGTQTDGGFRDAVIRNGTLILDNATLLMDKTGKDSAGNIDPSASYSGLLNIESTGTLGAKGTSFIHGGDVSNAGLINLNTNGSAANRLTIDGNYTSNGGTIAFGTALGNDASATDHLTITGNSSGSGKVSVTNIGGQGAQTIQGIELIDVQGSSDATFTKASRIVAGAYDYDLVKKGNNWYLTSTLSPIDPRTTPNEEGNPQPPSVRPEAGSYQANQIAANSLFLMRLHDRGGERQRKDPITGEEMKGMWMRHEFGKMDFNDSSTQLASETNRYVTQIGIDLIEGSSNGQNHLVGGLMAGYGKTKSTTQSNLKGYSSRGETDGWSTGIYGTWFEDGKTQEGAYADSWLQYSRFKNSVSGDELATENYWTDNVMASLELGYTFKLSETQYDKGHSRRSYIQPQAQVVQTFGNDIDHQEHNGTQVNSDGDNTQIRLGVRAFTKEQWRHPDGSFREFEPYGEINWLTSNTNNAVKMNETTIDNKGMKNVLEMRVGIRGQLTDNLSLWTDVTAKSGQQGYRDTMGQIGLKYDF